MRARRLTGRRRRNSQRVLALLSRARRCQAGDPMAESEWLYALQVSAGASAIVPLLGRLLGPQNSIGNYLGRYSALSVCGL